MLLGVDGTGCLHAYADIHGGRVRTVLLEMETGEGGTGVYPVPCVVCPAPYGVRLVILGEGCGDIPVALVEIGEIAVAEAYAEVVVCLAVLLHGEAVEDAG